MSRDSDPIDMLLFFLERAYLNLFSTASDWFQSDCKLNFSKESQYRNWFWKILFKKIDLGRQKYCSCIIHLECNFNIRSKLFKIYSDWRGRCTICHQQLYFLPLIIHTICIVGTHFTTSAVFVCSETYRNNIPLYKFHPHLFRSPWLNFDQAWTLSWIPVEQWLMVYCPFPT